MAKQIPRKLIEVEVSNPPAVYKIGDMQSYENPFSEVTNKVSPTKSLMFTPDGMLMLTLEDETVLGVNAKNLKRLVFVLDEDPPPGILVPEKSLVT